MGKDFALTPQDREKVMEVTKTPKEIEEEILEAERTQRVAVMMDEEDSGNIDRTDRNNFKIRDGAKLPEKFINAPKGDPRHLCVDNGGVYRKDWVQVYIFKQHEGQRDPQPFPLGTTWLVKLNQWTDVPPEVLISLQDAVETRHETNFKPGNVALGVETKTNEYPVQRFMFNSLPSA